jgi:hypothetical protein
VLELRQQMGLLQLGSGHQTEAKTTLTQLLSDHVRLHGPAHSTAVKLRSLLAGLP